MDAVRAPFASATALCSSALRDTTIMVVSLLSPMKSAIAPCAASPMPCCAKGPRAKLAVRSPGRIPTR